MKVIAAKQIMYHGTTSNFLRSILKKGMVFNPKQRVWDAEKGLKEWQDLESFGGTYYSSNFMTAYSAAGNAHRKLGGKRLLIVAQIETTAPDVVVDEDDILFDRLVIEYTDERFYKMLDPETLKLSHKDVVRFWKKFKDRAFYNKDVPKKINIVFPVFDKALKKYIVYLLTRLDMKTVSYTGGYEWSKAIEELKNNVTMPVARAEFRRAFDKLIHKLHFLAKKERGEGFTLHSVRVTDPVTYRGANRILCVVEVEEERMAEDKEVVLRVYYSKSDAALKALIKEYEKAIGPVNQVLRVGEERKLAAMLRRIAAQIERG